MTSPAGCPSRRRMASGQLLLVGPARPQRPSFPAERRAPPAGGSSIVASREQLRVKGEEREGGRG